MLFLKWLSAIPLAKNTFHDDRRIHFKSDAPGDHAYRMTMGNMTKTCVKIDTVEWFGRQPKTYQTRNPLYQINRIIYSWNFSNCYAFSNEWLALAHTIISDSMKDLWSTLLILFSAYLLTHSFKSLSVETQAILNSM